MESVHRWYRLTPSYSPSLVRFLIQELQISQEHFVLDPFSGRGTTSIECQKLGIKSLGIEINPLLQQIGSKSLTWNTTNLYLFEKYLTEVSSLIDKFKGFSLENVIEDLQTSIPNFLDLWKHIKSLKEVKATRFRGVYIVGNSRLSGVEIFTESILGKLFRHEGFDVERIVSFRKRGGKKRLYETAIFVRS